MNNFLLFNGQKIKLNPNLREIIPSNNLLIKVDNATHTPIYNGTVDDLEKTGFDTDAHDAFLWLAAKIGDEFIYFSREYLPGALKVPDSFKQDLKDTIDKILA